MELYSLYKKGRWGYFHITSMSFNSLENAEEYWKYLFGYKRIQLPSLVNLREYKIYKNADTNRAINKHD